MSPTVLVLALLSVSVCFGYKVYNQTTILDVGADGLMDMTVEGGTVGKHGAIINGTISYGKYPSLTLRNGKRSINVVTFWVNSDEGGSSLTLTDGSLVYNDLSIYGFSDIISSLLMATTSYVVNVYTSTYLGGSCWSFRTNAEISNLNVYSGFNDKIQSVQLIAVASGAGGSTMFVNANFGGLAVYVPSGTGEYGELQYPNIEDTASVSGFCGVFPTKALSSVIILAPGLFQFYQETDFEGTGDIIYGPGYTSVSQVDYNDKAQSAIAYNFD